MDITDLILSALLVSIGYTLYQNNKILNRLKHTNMATFSDLQTAVANLTTAVNNYVAAHSSDITAAQADVLVTDINAIAASLTP